MRRIFFLFALSLLSLNITYSREVINLNRGWSFSAGWEVQKSVGQVINLPHTWNNDALGGKIDYYRGLGNYVKQIEVPAAWKNKKIFIKFKGSNHTTDLYINGKHVGKHKGGYTAFVWDVTPYLRLGDKNILWVRVDNSQDLDLMPLVGDFNIYGGIYRDVELIVTPKTYIDTENYGSSGIFVSQPKVTKERADVNVVTTVVGEVNDVVEVGFVIRNAESQIVDSVVRRVKIENNGKVELEAMFTVDNPKLWNGVIDPYLYRAEVNVRSVMGASKNESDSFTLNFGLRYFEVDKNNCFLLNGEPYKIKGVVRMPDWSAIGSALSPFNHQRDIELMLEMGVNAVRLAYFPSDPYFVGMCDRAGIIVWSEIPFVGPGEYRDKGFNDSESFRTNGKLQLQEMIRQLYNHPSILFWGLFNELIQLGDDPVLYVRELKDLANEEDPMRLTVAASNQDGDLNFITDLIAFNKYFGWNDGLPSDLGRWGAGLRRDWSKLQVGVSEYGAGASIHHQCDSLSKPVVNSPWHPEQWQAYCHEQQWKTIKERHYFWGTFVNSMFDYGAAHRTDGRTPGIADVGLVTFDRATKKDAFYYYKAVWNNNDPFVHIADRRLQLRTSRKQTIKVYSNQASVELLINGKSHSEIEADGSGIFIWKDIPFSIGEHTIEAIASSGNPDRIRFLVQDPTSTSFSNGNHTIR